MAEKRVIELEIETNAKSLKAQLKEAQADVQQLSEKFGATSQEAIKAAKRAAELKDAIADAKDLTDSFNPDAKFNALTRSVGGVLDGFQAFEGALGLVGVESEKLQETMVRVQSVMALSQGLQGLMEAKDSFKQLGAVAVDALKGIRTGLAATGIGLFLVALGTVVAYWDDIKAAVSGVTAEQEKLNEVSKAKFETSKAELENLDAQDNILKLQGKSEREILNLKIAKVNTAIEDGKINLQNVIKTSKAEEEAAIKNYNLTKKIVDFILDTALFLPKLMLMPIDMAIKGANKVSEALGFGKLIAFDMGKTMEDMQDKFSGFIAGSIFNVEEVKAEGEKTRKELEKELKDLENQKAGFQLQVKDIDKAANDKAKESAKERNEIIANANAEAARLAIEQQNELNKRLEDLAEQNFQNTLTDQERELLAVQDKYFELETLAEGNKDALAQIELAKMNEINDINLKYQNEAYEAEKLAKEKKEQLDKEAKDKAIANEIELRKKQLQLAGDAFSALGDLIGSFTMKNDKDARKQFQIQKAFNLAAAITNTALAVTGALTAGGNPIKLATGTQFVEAGIAATVGLANVAKIASSKFDGGSSGGGGGAPAGTGGGGTMQAPNFSVIGSSGVNQLAQLQQQPTRAYVVSGEVTSQQALDRNRVQNATL